MRKSLWDRLGGWRVMVRRGLRVGVTVLVLWVLLGICAGVVRDKLDVVRGVKFVGHADEAGYVAMGQSLAEGRGLDVNYVSWFFIPYQQGITHREDHWPPFLGFAMVPFFWAYGVSAYVSKMAPILIGTVALPLMTAALGMVYSRRGYVGLIAGLLMVLNATMYTESMKTLSDVPAAMLLTGFCWALLAARERPWMHAVAGVFAAGCYYAKGSEIILLALYPLMTVLICGVRARVGRLMLISLAASLPVGFLVAWRFTNLDLMTFLAVCGAAMVAVVAAAVAIRGIIAQRKWMWAGMATAVLLMAPFWYSNWRNYGHPLHSTQNYVSGYIGLLDPGNPGWGWEVGTYTPYWGKGLPQLSDRWNKYPWYWEVVSANREAFGRWALLGPGTSREAWNDWGSWGLEMRDVLEQRGQNPTTAVQAPVRRARRVRVAEDASLWERLTATVNPWQEPMCEVPGAAAVGLVLVLLAGTPVLMLLVWGWRKWRGSKGGPVDGEKQGQDATSWLLGPTMALVMIVGVHWLFLVHFWQRDWMNRLMFVALPIVAVIGVTGISRAVELPVTAMLGGWKLFWPRRYPGWVSWWHLPLTVAVTIYVGVHGRAWAADRLEKARGDAQNNYPWCDQPGEAKFGKAIELGEYFKAHLPHAVFMSRYPQQMLFYAAATNKATNIPLADAETIFAIAKYYGVTHYVNDGTRDSMGPYVNGARRGLKRVAGGPGNLYEIEWDQLDVRSAKDVLAPSMTSSAMR